MIRWRAIVAILLMWGAGSSCTATTRHASPAPTTPAEPMTTPAQQVVTEPMTASFCPDCGVLYPGEVQYCPADGAELTPKS